MTHLADPKTTHEANALKGVALDHLGPIGARIRLNLELSTRDGSLKTFQEVCFICFRSSFSTDDRPHQILTDKDVPSLNRVFLAQQAVLAHLELSEKNTGEVRLSYPSILNLILIREPQGAAQFTRALFGRDLIQAAKAASNLLEDYSPVDLSTTDNVRRLKALADRLAVVAQSLWSVAPVDDVFGPRCASSPFSLGLSLAFLISFLWMCSPDDEQPRIDLLTLQLSRSQPLASLYKPLLERVVGASESTAVTFRTKSLRSISLLVAQDPELFLQVRAGFRRPSITAETDDVSTAQDDVSESIRNRIVDSSPAVRDTAIELVGKYVVGRPDLAIKFLPVIMERINVSFHFRASASAALKVFLGTGHWPQRPSPRRQAPSRPLRRRRPGRSPDRDLPQARLARAR